MNASIAGTGLAALGAGVVGAAAAPVLATGAAVLGGAYLIAEGSAWLFGDGEKGAGDYLNDFTDSLGLTKDGGTIFEHDWW